MKRLRNIDYLRAMAILLIVVYHCYVICDYPWTRFRTIHLVLCFSGEIGVTLFWALSGFGIFCSLYSKESQGEMPTWRVFMKQRWMKLAPQYYASVCICVLFYYTGIIGNGGWKHILAYMTFTQNLFISTHGSINGALWTMGTIFQFYIVAIALYRIVNKRVSVSIVGSIMITIASKIVIYHVILSQLELENMAYFIYGRQLISALDNFVLGMAAAKIVLKLKEKGKSIDGIRGISLCVLLLIVLIGVSCYFVSEGVYGDNLVGYTAHSILAGLLAGIMICIAVLPEREKFLVKPVAFFAKNQYGMYLWHLPIIKILHDSSPFFLQLLKESFSLFTLGVLAIVMVIGYYSTKWIGVKRNV